MKKIILPMIKKNEIFYIFLVFFMLIIIALENWVYRDRL